MHPKVAKMSLKELRKLATTFLEKTAQEAWGRAQYIDNLEHYLSGGLGEYFKSKLAEKNNQNNYVKHWMNETRRLVLREFENALCHQVSGVGNYDKVFEEVKKRVLATENGLRRTTINTIEKYFKIKVKNKLVENDSDEFWNMVDFAYADAKSRGFSVKEDFAPKPAVRSTDFKGKKK